MHNKASAVVQNMYLEAHNEALMQLTFVLFCIVYNFVKYISKMLDDKMHR